MQLICCASTRSRPTSSSPEPLADASPRAPPQERVAFWRGLGFSTADLRQLLAAAPRLLLYPMHERKYQAKLRFLQGEWGRPACFPCAASLHPCLGAVGLMG